MIRRRAIGSALALGAALSLALAAGAPAAGGGLDQSFSHDGKKVVFFGLNQNARGVAVDGHGRALLAGGADNGTPFSSSFGIVRLTAAGEPDPAFSGDGKRRIDFPGHDYASAEDVAVDAQGRIVVAGYARSGTVSDFAVARLLPDGSLDHSFSGDGKRIVSFADGSTTADTVALDRDGRIVLAGAGPAEMAFGRLLPGGALDDSFSGDGRATPTFGPFANVATDVAIDGAGRIVASALAHGNTFGVIRLRPGGGNDSSFAGDGKVTEFGTGTSASGVVVEGNRVLASGIGSGKMVFARYLNDGGLDGSFSGDGKREVGMGDSAYANDVGLEGNRIVAVGQVSAGSSYSFGRPHAGRRRAGRHVLGGRQARRLVPRLGECLRDRGRRSRRRDHRRRLGRQRARREQPPQPLRGRAPSRQLGPVSFVLGRPNAVC
jgi:serralysin